MKTVLVADDEIRTRALYEEVLSNMGCLVLAARTGKEACEVFQKRRPDLLILNMKMPEMHGLDVIERIRATDPDVPIIVCSGYPMLKQDSIVMTMNIFEFINKPINVELLRRKVREALSQSDIRTVGSEAEGSRRL